MVHCCTSARMTVIFELVTQIKDLFFVFVFVWRVFTFIFFLTYHSSFLNSVVPSFSTKS